MTIDGAKPEKIAKTRVKYLRAPLMLVVGSAPGRDEHTTLENRDAVAAGVQNILLGATSEGLASFWSTISTPRAPALLQLCGFEAGTIVVALIYLGHPVGTVPAPARRSPTITWVG
jgi:nitroreductase